MKIWLDDLRVAPDGYETAKSVNEAIDLIEECEQNGEEIEVLDLEHDLGDYAYDGGDAQFIRDNLSNYILFRPTNVDDFVNQMKGYSLSFEERVEFKKKYSRDSIIKEMADSILNICKFNHYFQ